MNDLHTAELRRMVADDPVPTTPPDLDALLTAGRRRVRRRRLAVGATAVAAVAAVGVPTYLWSSGTGAGTDRVTDDMVAAAVPTATGDCGQLLCGDPRQDSAPERAPLAGEHWVVGRLSDGTEEVIYAATSEGAMVDVLMVGHREAGDLRRVAATVQPGSEGRSPDGDPVRFWTNPSLLGAEPGGDYLVVGFVEGAPEQITWSTPNGDSGPVDGVSTTVVDGYTVFYLSQPYPAGSEPRESDRDVTHGKDGEVVLEDAGGAQDFPPNLTIHTSDGWSCSLADCGSRG